MQATMTAVGLDVHARSTHAAAIDVVTGELRRSRFGGDSDEVVTWLAELPRPVRVAYEAGPTGFALARAAKVRRDLARGRHRVSKLLLVEGRVYPGKTTWKQEHHRWLARQQFAFAETELAFIDLLAAVDGLVARRQALDERLARLAEDPRLWPTVSRLRAFRGVDTLTALALHLELGGDWRRFSCPRKLSSWLGLTPSLDQSGESAVQGSITKTGSSIARRLLVEAAWHYARPARIGVELARRQAGQPDHVLQIAHRAQRRLHRTHHRFKARAKPANVATIAVARELAGFLWAAATAP
jgi:transposase